MNILVAGDSITEGITGRSYIRLLQQQRPEHRYINLGLGGDTLKGITKRTLRFLRKRGDVDLLIFQAGHNDIILPSFAERSLPFRIFYRILKQRGSVPTSGVKAFERVYRHTLHNLMRQTSGEILVLTLSCITESPDSREDTLRREYNAAIKRAALDSGIAVADIGDAFDAELKYGGSSYKNFNVRGIVVDGIISRLPQGAERISIRRDLHLTIDGVHLNDRGAQLYADVIMREIDSAVCREQNATG